MVPSMKTIDESKLETDLAYRFHYLSEFIGFCHEDINTVHAAAPALAPLVKGLVDAVYAKLFQYSSTWRHFLPRQHGYDGDVPMTLETLTPDHPQISFRKEHLGRYLVALVSKPYDGTMVEYLDRVGKIHIDKAGSRAIMVPLVQMNALMGFVADAFNATILTLGLPKDKEMATVRAFSKLLWIQNDLIARHYMKA
ncbi:hypothetical protein BH11PLA2_BH11PLA2_09740 [soil metagenome]